MVRFARKHPYVFQIALSFAVSLVIAVSYLLPRLLNGGAPSGSALPGVAFLGLVAFVLFSLLAVYPLVLLGYQAMLLIRTFRWATPQPHRPAYDTWVLGFLAACELIYLSEMKDVMFFADWRAQLVNSQRHAPIAPSYYVWFALLLCLCLLAFYTLWRPLAGQLPPLVQVFAIAVLYITTAYVVVWTIQVYEPDRPMDLYLLVPAVVFALIAARTIATVVQRHALDADRAEKVETHARLAWLHALLTRAKTWPILAFGIALPALGLVYALLVLLGQGPHALIRAFTDTSQWTLSQHTSPPNLSYDEHYLCTVAAGGHPQLVQPLRGGIRHGHPVTVNRQLLIANAFEQVISDRLPRTHRAIRRLYDRYGFDLATRIKTPWAADVVWVLMKPCEWVFLAVIYLCVNYPEDLIAMQYTDIHYRHLDDIGSSKPAP